MKHQTGGAVYPVYMSCLCSHTHAVAILAASLCLASAAQQPAPPQTPAGASEHPAVAASGTPTLSVNARLVNLPVVVRDKKGGLVANLTREDFILDVDSRPQTIRYFDRDNNLPLTLGLLVDTSMSVASALEEERTAGTAFLDDMLASDRDKAFVVQFARSTELLQDVTNSRPKLQGALRGLNTENPRSRAATDPDPNADPSDPDSSSPDSRRRDTDRRNDHSLPSQRGGGTTLYDALFLSSDEVIGKQTGRKALVILSDGEDNGSRETLAKSIEAAQRADTIVYAIYFKGEGQRNGGFGQPGGMPGGQGRRGGGYPGGGGGYPGGGGRGYPSGGGYPGGGSSRRGPEERPDGKKVLERMARETGGRLFEVSHKLTIDAIYKQIAEELRAQYRLGYTPEGPAAGAGYHEVSLGLSRPALKSLTVQTREGYYTGK